MLFYGEIRRKAKNVGLEVHLQLLRNFSHLSVELTQKAYLDLTDKETDNKYQRHSPINNLKIKSDLIITLFNAKSNLCFSLSII